MLTELPWELGQLDKNLNILDVGHNPLIIPPRPVINKGTAEIVAWLKKNEKEVRVMANQINTKRAEKEKSADWLLRPTSKCQIVVSINLYEKTPFYWL